MTKRDNREVEPLSFSHPAQDGWTDIVDLGVPKQFADVLAERYYGTAVHPSDVILALGRATQAVSERRIKHEKTTIEKLVLNSAEVQTYYGLAGKSDRVADYIDFFSTAANQRLDSISAPGLTEGVHLTTAQLVSRIALASARGAFSSELGGNRQYGMFGVTAETDALSKKIPKQLGESYPEAHIRVYSQNDPKRRYRYVPLAETEDWENAPRFSIIERRRPVVDVRFSDRSRTVEVFKTSTALILHDYLRPTVNKQIFTEARAVAAKRLDLTEQRAELDAVRRELAAKRFVDGTDKMPFPVGEYHHDISFRDNTEILRMIADYHQLRNEISSTEGRQPGTLFEATILRQKRLDGWGDKNAPKHILPIDAHYVVTVRPEPKP